MKIGLVDVDGHNFPNIALMKLSAYHKSKGDEVEKLFPMSRYDKVYMSKVFDFTPDFETCINADEIVIGGRAYDKKIKLPNEIESIYPDYSLYNIKDTAYGYLTRGCPRECPFCDVVNIEGNKSYKVADLKQFWSGQREIKLLDPNLFASKDKIELLQQLVDSKSYVDFTQGVDARLLTDEVINKLIQIKIKIIHFAWDNMKDSEVIVNNLKRFKDTTGIEYQRLKVYVLTNYNTTMEENLYRIYRLKELGYDPYVMVYEKWKAPKEIKRLQRWVNNKVIFRSGNADTFEEYLKIS